MVIKGVLLVDWLLLGLWYCGLLVLGIEEIGVGFRILGVLEYLYG